MSCNPRTSRADCQVKKKNEASCLKEIHIFRWFHNNIELNPSEGNVDLKYKISSSNNLLLLHTSKHDNGKYQCTVINEAGQDSIDLHLDINGKHCNRLPSHDLLFFILVSPIVTVESNEIIGIVNKPITLNCQADGYPIPRIYWTKAGRSIDTQPGKYKLERQTSRY